MFLLYDGLIDWKLDNRLFGCYHCILAYLGQETAGLECVF